jgi:hypothetical protein
MKVSYYKIDGRMLTGDAWCYLEQWLSGAEITRLIRSLSLGSYQALAQWADYNARQQAKEAQTAD